MAVPKKRKSSSKTRMGRSHKKLKTQNIVENQTTGTFCRPHHISPDGFYNGKQILIKKTAESAQS